MGQADLTVPPPVRGAGLGLLSGAAGGGVVGAVIGIASIPSMGKLGLLAVPATALNFALFGAAVGAFAEPHAERHPERSPGDRMRRGAVMPAIGAAATLGPLNALIGVAMYQRGLVDGRTAILGTVVGAGSGIAAAAASGAFWGLAHG